MTIRLKQRYYSIGEVSRILGVSVRTIYRWEKQGKISAIRTAGGHRRFFVEEIERFTKAEEIENEK